MPYAILHDGLLMPLFGCIVLGLAGENLAGYCVQLAPAGLSGRGQLLPLPAALQPVELDSRHPSAGAAGREPLRSLDQLRGAACAWPWLALHLVEKPAQRQLRKWMGA